MTPALKKFSPDPLTEFARDVCAGLSKGGQKTLPSRYLYDELGSSLYEAITFLPEYGATRAEERLFLEHADEIVEKLGWPGTVVELGSGSGRKTKQLLDALSPRPVTYYPIDVSRHALKACESALRDIPGVTIAGLNTNYLDGLETVSMEREPGTPLAILFLGSTIGNFDERETAGFLADMRKLVRPGDRLLLGADLLKPVPQLIDAYDDPLRVTAAFNLNLLNRINRELDGDFEIACFQHVARFDHCSRNIEMHLRALRAHDVSIRKAGLVVSFEEGETIWTESSHKYTCPEIVKLGERAGFSYKHQWIDEQWPFADSLFVAT
jgi:L-histidine Nalpha-methyltransferase